MPLPNGESLMYESRSTKFYITRSVEFSCHSRCGVKLTVMARNLTSMRPLESFMDYLRWKYGKENVRVVMCIGKRYYEVSGKYKYHIEYALQENPVLNYKLYVTLDS